MFVELSDEKEKIVINTEHILYIRKAEDDTRTKIQTDCVVALWVDEDLEEVKKRLGMAISPRAGTIMAPDVDLLGRRG